MSNAKFHLKIGSYNIAYMKLNKAQMHQRPTYETLVKDTILEPKDKIALPDRAATILRKTQQLTRYDDAEFLDLEKDNEQIAKEQAQQATLTAAAGGKHQRKHRRTTCVSTRRR